MNTAKDQRTEVRAKALRPGDSGVFHKATALALPAPGPDLKPATEQAPQRRVCSVSDLDRALAALLRNSLRADGLSHSDAGAACNRQRQQVSEMCQPDGRVRMSATALIRICGVSPSMRAAVRDLLDQETRSE